MNKRERLQQMLAERGVPGEIIYSRKHPIGWMYVRPDLRFPMSRLGWDFDEAVALIEKGVLDFLATHDEGRKADVGLLRSF